MERSPPHHRRPARLAPGARMALIAPAGPVDAARIDAALEQCARLGLEPVLGRSARRRYGYLAGEDEARLADLNDALRDERVDAIWALRGGYGTMRLLPRLDLSPLLARPRAFIGFSDNTALHLALDRLGLVSFHGPHAGAAFPAPAEDAFRRVLFRAEPAGAIAAEPARTLVAGAAEGTLIGGNLALLAALAGTPYALRAAGRVVVIEDVGEPAYRIDRALTQLLLAGCLHGAAAIAFGRFDECADPEPGRPLDALLRERVAGLLVPVLSGLPVGHIDDNRCLPFGVRARLDADVGTLTILEPAVV